MIDLSTLVTVWEVLGLLALILVLSICTALIEMMFQYFMQPNMILYPWAVLLSKIASKGEHWRHIMRPLGRCRYCNSVWITMYSFLYIFHSAFVLQTILWLLVALGINFFSLHMLTNHIIPHIEPNERVDQILKIEFKHPFTPHMSMLKAYGIMGIGYAIIYGVIPLLV